MQFSAILGQFLPRAPRCASLRCVFFFQIFYILYFTTLARILDPLGQTRLDFCPVQDAVFYSGTPSAAHLVHCPDLHNLSFFTWMSARPWTLWLQWLPVPLYGPFLCRRSSMAAPPGSAPVPMRTMQLSLPLLPGLHFVAAS